MYTRRRPLRRPGKSFIFPRRIIRGKREELPVIDRRSAAAGAEVEERMDGMRNPTHRR